MSLFDRPSAPPTHPSVTSPRRDRPTSLCCTLAAFPGSLIGPCWCALIHRKRLVIPFATLAKSLGGWAACSTVKLELTRRCARKRAAVARTAVAWRWICEEEVMRQAPCQPNLLKFSNMCQRDYPAPSDIYLLPNPAVARLAPTNAPLAQMMSQGRGVAWS